jgi:Uma2 family endonuclease
MTTLLDKTELALSFPERTTDANGYNPRKRWTRADADDFVKLGKLPKGGWELLEGEIVFKEGKDRPHVITTHRIYGWFIGVFGFDHVQNQDPIRWGSFNEPEPDVSVMLRTHDDYACEGEAPDASTDVPLVVEVTDSTVHQDKIVKPTLYAMFGVPEYWMVDVNKRQIRVHRNPVNGTYQDIDDLAETQTIVPLHAPAGTAQKLICDLLP